MKKLVNAFSKMVEIDRKDIRKRAFVVAIEGNDLSGKTTFSKMLKEHLKHKNLNAHILHQDNFANKKSERNLYGKWSPKGFYYLYWDYKSILEYILRPINEGKTVRYQRPIYDFHSDSVINNFEIVIHPSDILIIEGLFLLRDEYKDEFDLIVEFIIPSDTVIKRALARDVPLLGDSEYVIKHYNDVVLPAHAWYKTRKAKEADIIVDTSDFNEPRVIKWKE